MAQQQHVGSLLFPPGMPMPAPSLLTGMRSSEEVLEQQRQADGMIEELQRQLAQLENSKRDLEHDLELASQEITQRDRALSDTQEEMNELARSQDEGAAARLASLTESTRKDKRQLIEEQTRCRDLQEKLLEEQEQSRRLKEQLEHLDRKSVV